MKVAAGLLVLFIFGYWGVPFFFHAMAAHDYNNLYGGMQDARKNGGLSYDKHQTYHTYADKYARGE